MRPTKLTIELIPETVWYSSLYNIFKDSKQEMLWRDIKNKIFEREGRKCWICGKETKRLEAHEFWEYDDDNHIQKLAAIHHLCGMCHKVKHIGLWLHTQDGERMLEEQGLMTDDIIQHFCEINHCSENDFETHEKEAFEVWSKRSTDNWKQDFGVYSPIVAPLINKKNISTTGME